MNRLSARLEPAVAGLLTIAAVWLNYVSTASAGGLWRDEANTVALANLPRIGDVWNNIQFDSFPIFWLATVRIFSTVFGAGNDAAFRVLGFLIGTALVATLWTNARSFGHRFPLLSLSLIAVAPSVVRWGDSMRAYGLGMVLIMLTMGAVWRYARHPTAANLIVAALVAMISVHTIYYNSVLLLAICAGASAVCLRRRDLRATTGIIAVGFVSALSLTPYVATIRAAASWNSLVRIPEFTTEWFFLKLYETLSPAGNFTFVLWLTLFLFCLAVGASTAVANPFRLDEKQKDNVLFATITLFAGSGGSFLFLHALSYATQPWYYLTLVLIAGVSMDIIVGSICRHDSMRMLLCVVTLILGIVSTLAGIRYVGTRLTNADLVAERLKVISTSKDLIVVNPWYDGVSFDRYFRGNTEWLTVPPVSSHSFHRYDIVMKLRALPSHAPMAPVLEGVSRVLMSGSTVFVVGTLPKTPRDTRRGGPNKYAAADDSLQKQWSAELGKLISDHAVSSQPIVMISDRGVSRYEEMTVTAIRGWR